MTNEQPQDTLDGFPLHLMPLKAGASQELTLAYSHVNQAVHAYRSLTDSEKLQFMNSIKSWLYSQKL